MGERGQQIAVPGDIDFPVSPAALRVEAVPEEEEQAADGNLRCDAHGDRPVIPRHRDRHGADLAAGPQRPVPRDVRIGSRVHDVPGRQRSSDSLGQRDAQGRCVLDEFDDPGHPNDSRKAAIPYRFSTSTPSP
jgi:hypothetical protein